jgi:uncharacterized protein (TIGR02145 family)
MKYIALTLMYLMICSVIVAQVVLPAYQGAYYNDGISCGTVTDYDGNVYQTVRIGNQCWMAENLRTTHYSNGVAIPHVSDALSWQSLGGTSKAWCYYNNDANNAEPYGLLYTWAAATNGAASSNANPSGVQGVCPDGWHLPSDAEWIELEISLGMSVSDTELIGARGTTEGGALKETGTTYWQSPNTGATNASGFGAVGGGYRYRNGTFNYLMQNCYFRTSTIGITNTAYSARRMLSYNSSQISRADNNKTDGLSVRCVKD